MIRVGVVDDQTLVRQGICGLLALSSDVEVVAEGADGDDALAIVESGAVDVLLLDLRMPGRDGISALTELRTRGSVVPVLVLTTFDDDELTLQAVGTGARGFLLKDITLEQLVAAIHTLAAGGTVLQPALTERLIRTFADPDRPAVRPSLQPALSQRELDVLRLVAGGYSNREIASALFLATGTVKNHVSNILLKLEVRDRTRAVLRAMELGILHHR
jgi:DNA-binding NarL/FixJ family response regulator